MIRTATSDSAEIVETDFAELEDGSLLELIEAPEDCSKTLFVLFKNREFRLVDRYEFGWKNPRSRLTRSAHS
jgi:hypothetical protein